MDNPASLALPSESSFLNASPKPPKMFKADNDGGIDDDGDDNWTNATTIQWLSDTSITSAMRKDERIVWKNPSIVVKLMRTEEALGGNIVSTKRLRRASGWT